MENRLFLFLCIVAAVVVPSSTVRPALLLSPYLNENRLQEAKNLSLVDPKLFLNTTSYSGFFTVDKRYNSNIFFWYFPVANRVVEDTPWIIWLQGGPGVSSLVGLFNEMGPFDQPFGFKYRKTSWCNEYSMVFIDNPVGAGFSFTDHNDGLPRDMETYTNHLFSALEQFVKMFPELRRAPLYIAGSSYAGRYVPALGLKISEADSNDFNLQGLILGNPVFNRDSVMNYSTAFYQWGLIDQQGLLAAKPLQDKYIQAIQNGQSESAAVIRNELLDKLQEITCQYEMYNILSDNHDELMKFVKVVTDPTVRDAIHVGDLGFTFSNSSVQRSLAPDFLNKVSPKIEALLDHYRILIYCGQLDLIAPCVQNAEARRRSWHWSRRQQFLEAPRVPWWTRNTVAGYVKSGGGLTEVLVRGAGHIAPVDKPAEIQEIVSYFIQGRDVATPPSFHAGAIPDYLDLQWEVYESSNAGLIVSVFINVLLVVSIVALVLWFLTWKRKNDAVFIPLREDIFNVA